MHVQIDMKQQQKHPTILALRYRNMKAEKGMPSVKSNYQSSSINYQIQFQLSIPTLLLAQYEYQPTSIIKPFKHIITTSR